VATERDIKEEVRQLQQELFEKQQSLAELKRHMPLKPVPDYELLTLTGPVNLSELFGDKEDLLVIHNMGKDCPYCTLWADGFIGLHPHLLNRCAFVLVSPDPPEIQAEFAQSRNWPFQMASAINSDFIKEMGFASANKGEIQYMPGFSTFNRTNNGKISLVGQDFFGPGDVYNAVWHFFDLLRDGPKEWEPKYSY